MVILREWRIVILEIRSAFRLFLSVKLDRRETWSSKKKKSLSFAIF